MLVWCMEYVVGVIEIICNVTLLTLHLVGHLVYTHISVFSQKHFRFVKLHFINLIQTMSESGFEGGEGGNVPTPVRLRCQLPPPVLFTLCAPRPCK